MITNNKKQKHDPAKECILNNALNATIPPLTHIATKLCKLTTAVAAAICLALPTHTTMADTNAKVYKVEILIFERLNSHLEPDQEQWRKNIKLEYPSRIRNLIEHSPLHEQILTEQAEIEGTSTLTESAESTKSLNEKKGINGIFDDDDKENYFHLLPAELRTLNQQARSLDRKSMRVIFHEAWEQPITDLDEASAITIQGGEKYDGHYELEGSITLSVSRYLHAHTNLWLTLFEPNYGQQPYYWPPLPTPPISDVRTTSQITTEEDNSKRIEGLAAHQETGQISPATQTLASNELELVSSGKHKNTEGAQNFAFTPTLNNSNFSLFKENNTKAAEPATHLIKEVITLKQSRKMRSTELHYIDHPRIGMLIRVDPAENKTDS